MLAFMEGFDKYAAPADLGIRGTIFTTNSAIRTTGGRFGGGCLEMQRGSGATLFEWPVPIDGRNSPLHYAFWMRLTQDALDAGRSGRFIHIGNNIGTTGASAGLSIQFTADGSLGFYPYGGTSTFVVLPGVLNDAEWHHIEVEMLNHTGGSVRIWIDGVLRFETSANFNSTAAENINQCRLITPSGSGTTADYQIDDLVFWNETGSEFTYTHLGEHQIQTLNPVADVSTQFTRESGSDSFAMIDEPLFHDGDTTYNESFTVGHVDIFEHSGLIDNPLQVFALQLHIRAKKLDTGDTNARIRALSNSTLLESADFPLTANYYQGTLMLPVDPDTNSPWADNTAVNDLQIGYSYHS